MEKRVFLIVLDSFGIGAEPDAAAFGDEGTNTLGAIAKHPNFNCPNLQAGPVQRDGVAAGEKTTAPIAPLPACRSGHLGKDTTVVTGDHGVVADTLPTFPNSFPDELIRFRKRPVQGAVQQALPKHAGAEGLRRAGHERKRPYRLHQCRQHISGGRQREKSRAVV